MFFAEPLKAKANSHSPASKRPSIAGALFMNGTEKSAAINDNEIAVMRMNKALRMMVLPPD